MALLDLVRYTRVTGQMGTSKNLSALPAGKIWARRQPTLTAMERRSAIQTDLLAADRRKEKIDRLGDPLTVELEANLATHWQSAEVRMRAHPVVLCLQDTTEFDFNGQRIAGLGPLSYEVNTFRCRNPLHRRSIWEAAQDQYHVFVRSCFVA